MTVWGISKILHPQDIAIVTATCHDVKVSYDMNQLYYTYNKYHNILI